MAPGKGPREPQPLGYPAPSQVQPRGMPSTLQGVLLLRALSSVSTLAQDRAVPAAVRVPGQCP